MAEEQDEGGQVGSPTWRHWTEIPAVCLHSRNLVSTVTIAAIVGTVLFAINQLDVVLREGLGPRVLLKAGLTYVVPFLVSNYGLVVGTRAIASPALERAQPAPSETRAG